MRQVNCTVLSGSNGASVIGSQIDSNQLINASFHLVQGDASASGSFIIQGSNDVAQVGPTPFTVTNWATISTTAQAAATQQVMVQLSNISYRWLRCQWTKTDGGSTTATVQMMAMGA